MQQLAINEFGDPILRKKARRLTPTQVRSPKIQQLIKDMRHTLVSKQLGIGLAAPQVGQSIALSVIALRPTKHRPNVANFDVNIINPKITKTYGKPKLAWEGCISSGHGQANLFGKVRRYHKIELSYLDETGQEQLQTFDGLVAQVIQHEVDHLNGILFVDHVKDPRTYMTMQEYRKHVTIK